MDKTQKEKCDCLNYCGDDNRVSSGKVTPCNEYKPVAKVEAKITYSGHGYGSHKTDELSVIPLKGGDLKEGELLYRLKPIQEDSDELKTLRQRNAELQEQALRYEFVRKLTPTQFAEIYAINIKTGVHFDHLIDQAIIENEPTNTPS